MDEKIYLRLLYGMEEIPDGLARIIGRNPCYDLAGLPSPKLKEEIEGFIRYRSTQVSIGRMQGDKQFYNKVRRFLKECATAKSSLRDKAPETWVKQFRTWMFKEHIPLYYRSRGPTGKENISKAREIGYFERMLKFTAVDARREEEKDVWELDKLEIEHRENPIKRVRTLNFTRISQDGIRQELKKGIYLNLQGEAIACVQKIPVDVPRDRQATFEPQVIPKRTRDVSGIEDKVMSMYARGMSQRDIADTIEDIYGFEISHETISNITDRVIETAEEWQNRPLKKFYTFLFVDCLYVSIRKEIETKSCAVYVILGYDVNGIKDILGLWIGETEGKHYWMQIFDEIKARGVEDVLFISMDGVSGLEEGARSIFKDVIVQRCIVHLIRNSVKYIPSKDYKPYTAQLRKVYGASSLKAAEAEFERFKQAWGQYPGAVDVWIRNWKYVEQLFNYGSAVRKVMYTTNAIESVNSSFRKVTKKGSFPSEEAVRKALYLRITELYKKWNGRPVSNWAMVRNQLSMDDKLQARIMKYENF